MCDLVINKNYSNSFLCAKVLSRLPGCTKLSKYFNDRRHRKIEKDLMPLFEYSLNKTKYHTSNNKTSSIIWVFWWQGKNKMPSLVKKCYRSIISNRGKRKVILITQNNIKEYTTIPDYIYKKVNERKISLTHLSDILRFNLLNNFGGLWIDATIFVNDSLDVFNTNKLFTLSGYPDEKHFNVSYGRWTGFFIGGPKNSVLFNFMDTFFRAYWKYNDDLIDYFLIDYCLNYAWNKNLSNFKLIKNSTNPHLFDLQSNLNKKYNNESIQKLTYNTRVFKLSYKKSININDVDNVYSHLE